jgi:hypothetical protein
MWQIENHTPFGAQRAFARDRNGTETWLVAVKASYRIRPDGRIGIEEPSDPLLAPEYIGEPGKSSLKYASDLELTKPGTDIILHGHAYSPKDKPVSETGVLLKVGPVNKALKITGNRFYQNGISGVRPASPIPFFKMPLIYENTYGGTDHSKQKEGSVDYIPENPVGTGFALKKKNLVGQKAPNIEYVGNGNGKPACFGPIPADWMPRAQYGGTYDEKWMKTKAPFLPDDLDDRFFYCAPPDQQVPGYLKGGEIVEIYGMSPTGPLKFMLPSPDFTFKTLLAGKVKEHKATLHTVILEPDIPGFSMVWHTSLACQNQDHQLIKTVIT